MNSRMDKYKSNDSNITTSRSSRNRQLYDDLYTNTEYNNSVVLDDSKEVDINKIKEIIDKQEYKEERKNARPTLDFYNDLKILNEEVDEKVYDINEVLKEAKSKRDILEEASEKSKTNRKTYDKDITIEEELAKTRQVYDKLLQEETELLDIMNTLTTVDDGKPKKDAYKDLTTEANKFKTGSLDVKKVEKEEPEVLEDEYNNQDTTTEYNTNTFMFDKRDFVTEDSLKEHLSSTNKFIKVLIFLLVLAIGLAAYYVVTNYVLK